MGKIIIISNRLPVKAVLKGNRYQITTSEGGLATGLNSIFSGDENGVWIGWPGLDVPKENEDEIREELKAKKLIPVFLSAEEIKQFYEGFSNEILWPIFHYMVTYANYETSYWEHYRKVNEKFCTAVMQVAQPGDVIWVHDYQLLLLPTLLRQQSADFTIGFFLHIPFPSYELFRLIPWRSELLNGMLGADLVGFHTYDDVQHFLLSVSRILQVPYSANVLTCNNRHIVADAFPMGIDDTKFDQLIDENAVKQNLQQLQHDFAGQRVILSIDRLDYSKGILQRLQAFDLFLQENPGYLQIVSLYMIVVPSRDKVQRYKDLRDEIDKLVGNINARYRTNNWSPVNYFYRAFTMEELSALYQFAEVCLVTPMRDGMNLVCKEYIASRRAENGVLILSEMAGAAKELIEAIVVNPNNIYQLSESIVAALTMPLEEQKRRMHIMRDLVHRYNVSNWVATFMINLHNAKNRQRSLQTKYITPRTEEYIKNKYAKATKRLLLLDYDGTLTGFTDVPSHANPDKELYSLLEDLAKDEKNDVVVISGRAHTKLEEWFGKMPLHLIGEHGVWYRERGREWDQLKGLSSGWKTDIQPILDTYNERTPGAFTEEKTSSLVWHFRKVEENLGETRAAELINTLRYTIADLGLQMLRGNKVVEIKSIEANKGKSATHYINQNHYDFALAIGDDTTDEDMFVALADKAFTIKVGSDMSAAKYFLKDVRDVRRFLKVISSSHLSVIKVISRIKQRFPKTFQRLNRGFE